MEWDALAGPEKFSFCRQNFLGIKTLQVERLHSFAGCSDGQGGGIHAAS
jgi:hypothetical protein